MFAGMKEFLSKELQAIDEAGLYKRERIIVTPQTADIKISTGQDVINFCANNYLGLSDHPRLVAAAKAAMDSHGFGMSSVRFIWARRICTRSWSRPSPATSTPRTPSSTLRASMPMVGSSSHSSALRTLSSATP